MRAIRKIPVRIDKNHSLTLTMKKSSPLVSAVLAGAMALVLVTNVSAQEVKQLRAKVIRMSGHARFTTGNNVWQPLKVGDTLRAGTVIQTENQKGSYVDLIL